MGLKPDHWITRMAREHRMIEPFVDGQVRKGVISYGVSSYGYDIRVADEFKIFTNVHSTIVDPKHFDPKSMVDFQGEVCVIPPNSFALARTIEYFRIPRKVLTVCLGKCLTGDTRVVDADTGDYLPLRDFVERRAAHTVSLSDDWRLGRHPVSAHVNNGVQPVFRLTTRAGLKIKATATHPLRTWEGWAPLSALKAGERIAVARSCPVFGHEEWPEHEAQLLGLMLSDGQCRTPGHSPRYTSDDPRLVEVLTTAAQAFGVEVSPVGQYGYNLVNHRGRGGLPQKNRFYAWLEQLGCNVRSADKSVPSVVFRARRESVAAFLQALFSGDGSVYGSNGAVFLEYYSISERLAEDVRHLLLRFGIFAYLRHKRLPNGGPSYRVQITDPDMIQRFAGAIGFVPGSRKQQTLEAILASSTFGPARRTNFDTLPAPAWAMMREAVHARGQTLAAVGIRGTQPDQSLPYGLARQAALAADAPALTAVVDADVVWDTVVSIEPCGEEQVFDLTVPGNHNFVANDLVVHNSTYARCFRGDTRVALVDGSAPTLEDMARRAEDGEMFWGYSVGQHGQVLITLLEAPRYIGRDALLELSLDSGQVVRCTPDHLFLMRDGRVLPAAELRPGSSLMPLYRQRRRGYEMVYQPVSGHLLPTHRLADDWNLRHGVYPDQPGTHRHHVDGNRENNRPWNLVRMDAGEHIRYHNQDHYGPDFDPEEHGAAIRDALRRRAEDPEWCERFRQAQWERARQFWSDDTYAELRARVIEGRRHPTDDTRLAHRIAMLRRYRDPLERQRQSDLMKAAWEKDAGGRRQRQAEIARRINLRDDITADMVRSALDETGSPRGAARLLNCDRSVFRRFPEVISAFRGVSGDNHRVAAVRDLPGDHDVYCLTVPEAGNFALEAGVFVSNCGIIVNVTPFEPEWEGFVTLEISNTTPLPARIYANEGIAQVLFFEADEECDTSYADKKGKYQSQQTIELPKL